MRLACPMCESFNVGNEPVDWRVCPRHVSQLDRAAIKHRQRAKAESADLETAALRFAALPSDERALETSQRMDLRLAALEYGIAVLLQKNLLDGGEMHRALIDHARDVIAVARRYPRSLP